MDLLTRVSLCFIEHRVNIYLRFGQYARRQRQSHQRSQVLLPSMAVFCRVHWEANDYGTARWNVMVLRAGSPAERLQRVPGIHPGARILLHVEGERNVRAVFAQIDAIEAMALDPADVCLDYWIALGNRLHGRGALPHYTTERHEAWLRRRKLLSDSIVKCNEVERA